MHLIQIFLIYNLPFIMGISLILLALGKQWLTITAGVLLIIFGIITGLMG